MLNLLNFIPAKVLKVMLLLPASARKLLLEQITNQALASAIADDELDFLSGRWLELNIVDHQVCFYFTFAKGRVRVAEGQQGDVVFSGPLNSLLQLASKSVDPDTLFFQRKLMITGDTELGLEIKNLIDSLELENLPIWLNHPLRLYRYAMQMDNAEMQPSKL